MKESKEKKTLQWVFNGVALCVFAGLFYWFIGPENIKTKFTSIKEDFTQTTPITVKKEIIKKIYCISDDDYILFLVENGELKVCKFSLLTVANSIKFITDVPKGQDMWCQATFKNNTNGISMEMHIHDANDILVK